MNTIFKSFFIVTIFLFGCWNISYGANVAKIGIIDFQKIIEKSDIGKASTKKIKDRGNEMTKTLKEKEAEIEKRKKELDQKSLVMNKEAREEQERILLNKINDLKSLQRQYSRVLNELQNALLGKLEKNVSVIVEEIGKKEGYTLIMERKVGGVMYAPSAIDITDKVIRKLNALEQKKE
ncbi:MAG: OmpH family outer membrane protein [Deltaproteobacteria bacterium]|nr:OmpH family outer membrane protein [Deltaproteobacteria bacterium]